VPNKESGTVEESDHFHLMDGGSCGIVVIECDSPTPMQRNSANFCSKTAHFRHALHCPTNSKGRLLINRILQRLLINEHLVTFNAFRLRVQKLNSGWFSIS
jgi:hypothetical protein